MFGLNFWLELFQNQFQNSREECSTKGGTNDGTCASGFGVCCICK